MTAHDQINEETNKGICNATGCFNIATSEIKLTAGNKIIDIVVCKICLTHFVSSLE